MTEQEAKKILDKTDFAYSSPLTREAMNIAIKALEILLVKENADGCKGCAFESVNEWELPCAKCKRNSKDYWRAKMDNEDA